MRVHGGPEGGAERFVPDVDGLATGLLDWLRTRDVRHVARAGVFTGIQWEGVVAGEAGAPPKNAGNPRTSATSAAERGGSALRATLLLAVLLALVGVAGGGALNLLQHAMRVPTADDTAQLVCTAYSQQNYDLLLQQIDPAPVPPSNTGAFDANALRSQLKSLDASQGDVASSGTTPGCTYKQLDFSNISVGNNALQYAFTLHRAHASKDFNLIMTLVRESDGTWKISRASNFTGSN